MSTFYRKYRPLIIDEIDNPDIREKLTDLLNKDRKDLPHAYFFTGPKGTGKTTAARVIAKLFNCEKSTKSGPCGKCEQCQSIAKGSSLDVIEMDAASNRGIDEIRTLRDRINLVPASAGYTVYIIDEVHMLTTEAFNALLKTLEEPPAHAVFVLATTDAHKVPDTITSRCVSFRFIRAGDKELSHVINRIAKEEKLSIDDDTVALITHAADGSFRDAAKLLEQVSFHKGKITKEVVQKILSLSDEKLRVEFLSHLVARDAKKALALVESLVTEGRDIKSFMGDIMVDLHAQLITEQPPAQETMELVKRLTVAFGELRYTPIPSLPLELVVVEFCGVQPEQTEPVPEPPKAPSLGLLTLEKLTEHWADFIAALKPYNHSVAGVLRSSRPKGVKDGIVTIEAFYTFHQEKLSDIKTRQMLSEVLKKLFGEKVKVEVTLGKK